MIEQEIDQPDSQRQSDDQVSSGRRQRNEVYSSQAQGKNARAENAYGQVNQDAVRESNTGVGQGEHPVKDSSSIAEPHNGIMFT